MNNAITKHYTGNLRPVWCLATPLPAEMDIYSGSRLELELEELELELC